jgi:diguanylate cyclase (GGDEF)-like protein
VLEELAQRDAMTGLYHHTASLGLLETEMNRARSNGAPMSLIMMDIDDFKRINDTYGHQYGDDIISRTAAVLNSVVRGNGIVGRYGGEEFIIILPGADINAARLLSRRIQSAMDGNISLPGITLSGGISCYRGQTLDEFVRLADERLYQAKTRGKSCFVSSADETLQKAVWYRL